MQFIFIPKNDTFSNPLPVIALALALSLGLASAILNGILVGQEALIAGYST